MLIQFWWIHPLIPCIAMLGAHDSHLEISGLSFAVLFVLIMRIFAEYPGRKYGNSFPYFMLFIFFHMYGIVGFVIYEYIYLIYVKKDRFSRKIKFTDLRRDQIMNILQNKKDKVGRLKEEIDPLVNDRCFKEALNVLYGVREIALEGRDREFLDSIDLLIAEVNDKELEDTKRELLPEIQG